MNIEYRTRILVNTDSQRRCYNGCHFSSEWQWTEWAVLEYDIAKKGLEKRLEFWHKLNEYAVSQRGEGAIRELRVRP